MKIKNENEMQTYNTIGERYFDDIIKSCHESHDRAVTPIVATPPNAFPLRGSNLKLISRRDIRKLGEIVLSGFNYLENLDSPRKFPRRSTAKWMHPGVPSGFHFPVLILLQYYSLILQLPARIVAMFLPLDQPITRLSNRSRDSRN